MKRLLSVLLVAVMAVAGTVAMTGCGGSEKASNLEEYMAAHPEAVKEVEAGIEEANSVDGIKASVDFKGNCCIINVQFEETIGEEYLGLITDSMDAQAEQLQTTANESIAMIEEGSGIEGITEKYVYINGDGTEIWSKEYSKTE